jgi:hypothetical protein
VFGGIAVKRPTGDFFLLKMGEFAVGMAVRA